jgi:hypothetical protein
MGRAIARALLPPPALGERRHRSFGVLARIHAAVAALSGLGKGAPGDIARILTNESNGQPKKNDETN